MFCARAVAVTKDHPKVAVASATIPNLLSDWRTADALITAKSRQPNCGLRCDAFRMGKFYCSTSGFSIAD
jgi:hypothetical protein